MPASGSRHRYAPGDPGSRRWLSARRGSRARRVICTTSAPCSGSVHVDANPPGDPRAPACPAAHMSQIGHGRSCMSRLAHLAPTPPGASPLVPLPPTLRTHRVAQCQITQSDCRTWLAVHRRIPGKREHVLPRRRLVLAGGIHGVICRAAASGHTDPGPCSGVRPTPTRLRLRVRREAHPSHDRVLASARG